MKCTLSRFMIFFLIGLYLYKKVACFEDNCSHDYRYMCGNVCTFVDLVIGTCNCSGTTVKYKREFDKYCCTAPEVNCTKPLITVCPTGKVINIAERCNGRCYNSYDHSVSVGPFSHFGCPDGRCILVADAEEDLHDRCQGVKVGVCDNSTKECDESLVCHSQTVFSSSVSSWSHGLSETSTRQSIKTELGGHHHYCSYKKNFNNDAYEDIGRTDENITNTVNIETFYGERLLNCSSNGEHGIYCSQECKQNYKWCRSDGTGYYSNLQTCHNGDDIFRSNDQILCQDNLFWRDMGCNQYYSVGMFVLINYGFRCSGSIQHCAYFWYYDDNAETDSSYLTNTCDDSSDRLFYINSTCFDATVYNQLHNDVFHSYSHRTGTKYEDPHRCWDSCSEPGPGCLACTNEEYFLCQQSGVTPGPRKV